MRRRFFFHSDPTPTKLCCETNSLLPVEMRRRKAGPCGQDWSSRSSRRAGLRQDYYHRFDNCFLSNNLNKKIILTVESAVSSRRFKTGIRPQDTARGDDADLEHGTLCAQKGPL